MGSANKDVYDSKISLASRIVNVERQKGLIFLIALKEQIEKHFKSEVLEHYDEFLLSSDHS
uniref:Uncharacterized protein n=1 Tax=Romanomermis culicivorax TaxID=13658 RepID=A0A915IPJ6_ROMCU